MDSKQLFIRSRGRYGGRGRWLKEKSGIVACSVICPRSGGSGKDRRERSESKTSGATEDFGAQGDCSPSYFTSFRCLSSFISSRIGSVRWPGVVSNLRTEMPVWEKCWVAHM